MVELKNTFIQGKLNLDVDERLVPEGQYVNAENIKVSNSEGSESGALEDMLGNSQLTTFTLGANPKTLGQVSDVFNDTIYYFVKSDTANFVLEYNANTDTQTVILEDSRVGTLNVLNFDENFLITDARVLIDSNNNRKFLFFTDNLNPIRQVNVERAKTFGVNGFSEEDISLLKKPPLNSPNITLVDTMSGQENYIEEEFLSFSYRYRYLDGEYSALSPFSEFAFLPSTFNYDFSTSTNESMVNNFNAVEVVFNTGSSRVVNVDVVYKDSQSSNVYLIDSFNKSSEGWADDTNQTITFDNSKISRVLEEKQLDRYFDNVPLKAKSLELINNRLILGNYTEGFNLVDVSSNPVVVDISLNGVSTPITSSTPTRTLKSNRDYEVGIVYLDDYGRSTTVLTSENNTYYFGNLNSITKNTLEATISNLPPTFATHYRFFIKESRGLYDSIIPTLFYEDGVFIWVRIENSDVSKISEGDFLYVKADTQSLLDSIVQTKVLEIKDQPRNFLVTDSGVTETEQQAGTYFKIKPVGFRMNPNDFELFESTSFDNITLAGHDPIRNNINYIAPAVFYGAGLDDLTSGGTYTGTEDIRYLVEIDFVGDGVITFDTFRWSKDDGATYVAEDVVITPGVAQTLDDGVEITFAADSGHTISDTWIVSAKSNQDAAVSGPDIATTYGFYPGPTSDTINGGARITIVYNESGEGPQRVEKNYVSSTDYANLEEWFFGDNIDVDLAPDIGSNRIAFRRGTLGDDAGRTFLTVSGLITDPLVMTIVSDVSTINVFTQSVDARIEIFQSESNVIFETKPDIINTDIFYEVPGTYPIIGGFHTSTVVGDTNQTGVSPAIINLSVFNAYAWGNGFESVKIRDAFVANAITLQTRPLASVEDYRQNVRIASMTYSQPYEQTTNFNGINEFNLSRINFKDIDDAFGSIQKMWSRDTDLLVFQEDKTHKILVNKSILYNADGTGNVSQSVEVLGQEVAYAGEYGISLNPESFAIYGNNIWHTDTRRGCVLRLAYNGYFEISENGLKDYFRDYFKNNLDQRKYGAYDPYHDQYVLHLDSNTQDSNVTLTFDEGVKGWTSFHSFLPEGMISLNNKFYTIKDGQLYLHNDESAPRNTYYGVNHPSKISVIVNQNPSDIKVLKSLSLEGNLPLNTTVLSYLNDKEAFKRTTLTSSQYSQKEGYWYSAVYRDELSTNNTPKSVYGLGLVTNINVNEITLSNVNTSLTIGDTLFNATGEAEIGEITNVVGNILTVTLVGPVALNDFAYGVKNAKIEGSEMRGYTHRIDLEKTGTDRLELYAVNSNVFKSFK